MVGKILFILIISCFCLEMDAQKKAWSPRSWYVSLGVHHINNEEFNQGLAPFGLGAFNSFNPSISFGMNFFRNRFFLGYDVSAQTSTTVLSNLFRSSINTAETVVQVGYTVKSTYRWRFYPSIGAGTGWTSLKVENREVNVNGFIDILNTRSATIRNFYFSIPIAFHADVLLGSKAEKWLLGLSIGYTLTPTFRNWNYQSLVMGNNRSSSLNDIPPYNPGGWFMRFRIGFSRNVQ